MPRSHDAARCITHNTHIMSDTTTVRLPPDLKSRLESVARQQSRCKSWIIQRALDEYLTRAMNNEISAEARRQCLAANKADKKDQNWEQFGDWRE